jgi:exodeoxyribonuclease VII large subunit
MTRAAGRARRSTDALVRRLSPARLGARVSNARVRFAILRAARDAAISGRLDDERARLSVAVASLDALSPLAVLQRGYALARSSSSNSTEGRLLRDARAVKVGDTVYLRLAAGALVCRVEKQENN